MRHDTVTYVTASKTAARSGPPGHPSGDVEAAFRAVYAAQFPSLVRLAYVTTASMPAAEDIVQDSFIELYRRWEQVREPVAWLRRVVINRCTSWVRRRLLERRHSRVNPAPPDWPVGPEAVAMRAVLAQLRPRHRTALFLRYYLDLPEPAIAAAMGCRPGTVKSLLHRGLAALREHLDDSGL